MAACVSRFRERVQGVLRSPGEDEQVDEAATCVVSHDRYSGGERQSVERFICVGPGHRFIHLFPTNNAWNSVEVQPISTDRTPHHARTAAEMPNRRNCLQYL